MGPKMKKISLDFDRILDVLAEEYGFDRAAQSKHVTAIEAFDCVEPKSSCDASYLELVDQRERQAVTIKGTYATPCASHT